MITKNIAIKSDIELADTTIRGYKTPDNQWVLSLNSLGKILDKGHQTPANFIRSKWLRSRLGYTPNLEKFITEDNKIITAVSFKIALLFIRKEDKSDNLQASYLVDALLAKSLESRFEEAFSEPVYDVRQLESEEKSLYSLYIFSELKTNVTKIGISSDVSRRHEELQRQSGRELEIKYVSKEMSYKLAKQIESDLHEDFSDYRLYGEWFSVSYLDVLKSL